MADEKANTVAKNDGAEKPKEKANTVAYFRNPTYSGLTILVRGGEPDALGGEGVKEKARFTPYYDTFKGDVVRVGYLKTESADVIKRCREDSTCIEISEKEYVLATEGDKDTPALEKAPIPQA